MFSDSVLLRCCAVAVAGEMHAGTAALFSRRRVVAVSAASAGSGESAAPALVSAASPAPHTAGGQIRPSVRHVRWPSLHTGGQRGRTGARGAAAARERVRWTAQDGKVQDDRGY